MSDFKTLEGGLPADMTMLLRLIDSKFETMSAKMDGLQSSLDTMNKLHSRFDQRLDDHESRLQSIEQTMESRKVILAEYDDVKADVKATKDWMTIEQTTAKNAKAWVGAVWAVAGSAFTAIIGWIIVGYVGSLHPAPIEHREKTTIESVQTSPTPANTPSG